MARLFDQFSRRLSTHPLFCAPSLFPDEIDHQFGVESGVGIVNVSPRIGQNPRPANPVVLRMVDVAVNPKQGGMLLDKLVEV